MSRVRSIPAWTGEPAVRIQNGEAIKVYPRVDGGTWKLHCSGSGCWVYPRVDGGTRDRPTNAYEMVGLSRVTGNRVPGRQRPSPDWSIPRVDGGTCPLPSPVA